MPMLTTLRIGLPVWPVHSPRADPLGEGAHPVEHLVDLLDDVVAVDDQRAVARHPQRDVEDGAVLGDVDVLAGEHRVAALGDAALARPARQQHQRLVGDPVLGVVEEEAGALGDQALAAAGVLGEELAQVPLADLAVVVLQRLPGLPCARSWRLLASALTGCSARALLASDSIDSSRSSQDLTKASAPSSWRRAASASTSTPASANCGQHLLGVAAVGGQRVADLAVVGEGEQGLLGHRVDRVRRGEAPRCRGCRRRRGPWSRCCAQSSRCGRAPSFSSLCSARSRAARGRPRRRACRSRSRAGS